MTHPPHDCSWMRVTVMVVFGSEHGQLQKAMTYSGPLTKDSCPPAEESAPEPPAEDPVA